jgi:hypothetical protein
MVLYKGIYIKIVVIVNACFCVDKSEKYSAFSGLRFTELAEQTLYLERTTVEQILACGKRRRFCTSRPVDIQAVVHKRVGQGGGVARVCIVGFSKFSKTGLQSGTPGFGFFGLVCLFKKDRYIV